MHWISILFFSLTISAAELPRFLTKHSLESLRFISMDGRYSYLKRSPGVLSLVTSFKNTDFLTDATTTDFLVKGSRFKNRLIVESIPNTHEVMSLVKHHKIHVVDYGNTSTREVGQGLNPKLHLRDEWISYFDIQKNSVHIQNLVTQKKFEFILSKKRNPFFVPDVEMISERAVVYTDINEQGYTALVSYDLQSMKSNIVYKSTQTATRLELCQSEGYLAIGEFPYEGVSRGSKIMTIRINEIVNLAGYETIYNSVEQDTGNIVCRPDSIFFVKTFAHDKELNLKTTDVARFDLKTRNLQTKSDLKYVTQIVEMDNRVLIPFRGEFFVLEGTSNLGVDTLRTAPAKEELQIEI